MPKIELQPGPELDCAIAELVMGRTVCEHSKDPNRGVAQGGGYAMCGAQPECKGELHFKFLPRYSADIADAWKVLEHIVRQTRFPASRYFRIERRVDTADVEHYRVHLIGLDTPASWEVYGRGPTAPLAICEAALKYAQSEEASNLDRKGGRA